VISTESIPGGTTGGTYLVWLRITGGRAPFTWSVTSGQLPEGLEITPSGLIRGIPSKPGEYSFGLRVDDSQGNAAGSLFTTSFVAPLKIQTSTFQDLIVGDFMEEELLASGGTPPYSWELLEGEFPEGISLTDGRLGGLSNNPFSSVFTLGLSDLDGISTEKDFTLNIVDPVKIFTKTITAATSGTDYQFALEASGGSAPYSWIISEGSLPSGLEISQNGVITGLPTIATLSPIAITVSDTAGRSNTRNYEVFVSVGQELQIIAARGGTVEIEIKDHILKLVEIDSNDGFNDFILSETINRIQVHFIGDQDQWPSWVLCESYPEPNCSFD
jgi:hypothetical protein